MTQNERKVLIKLISRRKMYPGITYSVKSDLLKSARATKRLEDMWTCVIGRLNKAFIEGVQISFQIFLKSVNRK